MSIPYTKMLNVGMCQRSANSFGIPIYRNAERYWRYICDFFELRRGTFQDLLFVEVFLRQSKERGTRVKVSEKTNNGWCCRLRCQQTLLLTISISSSGKRNLST